MYPKCDFQNISVDFFKFNNSDRATYIYLEPINFGTGTKTKCSIYRHDSTHGTFKGEVRAEDGQLIVNGQPIKVYSCRDPSEIPWGKDNVEFVGEYLASVHAIFLPPRLV